MFKQLLGSGGQFGIDLAYAIQATPRGLADAFIVGRDFVGNDRVALVLGDNIFYGYGFPNLLASAAARETGATVFGYVVSDPERYGVVEFDALGKAVCHRGEAGRAALQCRGHRPLFLRQPGARHRRRR